MNKILVIDGKLIDIENDYYDIKDNTIIFKKSSSYYIEYINTKECNIEFNIINSSCIILYELGFDNEIVVNNKYNIDGNLTIYKFYSNKSVLENIDINLNRENSVINYYFSSICLMNEKYIFNINHNSKNTVSNIYNKAITLENSNTLYEVNSNVPRDMVNSILNQTTKIITFGDSSAKVLPNMFIECNDVDAKHGSVIGTVDEDILFYLMSRGINYRDAVKLYIKGFLFSNMKIDYDIKNKIIKIIDMYWR